MSEVGSAFRESPVAEVSFLKDEYTVSSALTFAFNHGFPKTPRITWLRLKCLTAERGYLVGDEVELVNSSQVTTAINSTQIKITFAALPTIVSITDNSVNAITAADWNLVVKAEV